MYNNSDATNALEGNLITTIVERMKEMTLIVMNKEEAIKKISAFHEKFAERRLYHKESLVGTCENNQEIFQHLENIKNMLNVVNLDSICFYCYAWETPVLSKGNLNVYFPGGTTYWQDFLDLK